MSGADRVSISGLEQLDELARRLDELPERAAKRAAPELLQVARAQHAAGVAPDGTAWPRTKGGKVPLTGLTSQASARVEGATVVLELPDELRPHQAGTAPLPQRKVMPDPDEELPPAWVEPFQDALEAELADAARI